MRKEFLDIAIEMLTEYDVFSEKMQEKFLFCKNGLKEKLQRYPDDPDMSRDPELIAKAIADCMNDFIKEYPAPMYYKEGLRNTFFKEFQKIYNEYGFRGQDCKEVFDESVDKYITDPVVEVVKMLHNQEGITKEEIARELNTSQKTVQTILHKLENEENPYRLCGVPITLKIDTDDRYSENCIYKDGDRYQQRRHYFTKNTMHPLTYQLNLMQVGTLLCSLCKSYYNDGEHGALYLGLNTWCQLSEYAKERIEEIYYPLCVDLEDFVCEMEDMIGESSRKFQPEYKLLGTENDYSSEEKLLGWYKGGRICGVELLNPRRTLRNQRIFFDHAESKYYAVPADNIKSETDRTYINVDDVYDIFPE